MQGCGFLVLCLSSAIALLSFDYVTKSIGLISYLLLIFSSVTMANRERTFIMIKPDGVQRNLVGKIISRFEDKGFKLVAMKFMQVNFVWEGDNVVKTGRDIIGATNPAQAQPGTLRGDLCIQVGRNIIHGSDSVPSADKEIALWFKDEELVQYKTALESWVYEN
ncbi:UNVERIFIED_CONTAM: Nucleoside diphosphate kinase A2 [Trichonephila clavipes]